MMYIQHFIDLFAPFLPAALCMLGNMARGQGLDNPDKNDGISHGQWIAYCVWIAVCWCPDWQHMLAFMWIVTVTTIFATGDALLTGADGDPKAILKAVKRNIWILPAMVYYPWAGLLLNQGTAYYLCRNTRKGEGVSGAAIGALL